MRAAHTSEPLTGDFDRLRPILDRIIKDGAEVYGEATEAARALVVACKNLRDGLYQEQVSQELHISNIKERITPFHQADILIEKATHPRIQTMHGLKKELSIASWFLVELVALQCLLKSERIRRDSVEAMTANIEKTLKTVPKKEVVNRFELKCCLSAIKKFDIDKGTIKELKEKHVNQISLAVIQTILTANPAPPFVFFNYLLPAVIELTQDLYNLLEEPWYKTVWLLRWHSAEVRIRTLENLGLIGKHLETYRSDHMVPFYISQLFMEVINHPEASEELKNALISDDRFSLAALAEHTPRVYLEPTRIGIDKPRYQDTFWRARYQALTHFRSLVQIRRENIHAMDQIAEVALRRMYQDKKETVFTIAAALVADIGAINPELIAEKSRTSIPISSVSEEISEIVERISEAEDTLAGEFPENNSTAGPAVNRGEIENDLKLCLEQRAKPEKLIQTITKTISLINQALETGHWDISAGILQLGGDSGGMG